VNGSAAVAARWAVLGSVVGISLLLALLFTMEF
jgi:hypothetical protein